MLLLDAYCVSWGGICGDFGYGPQGAALPLVTSASVAGCGPSRRCGKPIRPTPELSFRSEAEVNSNDLFDNPYCMYAVAGNN